MTDYLSHTLTRRLWTLVDIVPASVGIGNIVRANDLSMTARHEMAQLVMRGLAHSSPAEGGIYCVSEAGIDAIAADPTISLDYYRSKAEAMHRRAQAAEGALQHAIAEIGDWIRAWSAVHRRLKTVRNRERGQRQRANRLTASALKLEAMRRRLTWPSRLAAAWRIIATGKRFP